MKFFSDRQNISLIARHSKRNDSRSLSVPFYRRSMIRDAYYAGPWTHCAYFIRICTISRRLRVRTGQLFMRQGGAVIYIYMRRLGCRFIGRKISDLLISLVRHVGFVLLPVGIDARPNGAPLLKFTSRFSSRPEKNLAIHKPRKPLTPSMLEW